NEINIPIINKPVLYNIINQPYINDMLNINHDVWINNGDFTDNEDENDIFNNAQLSSICEEILYIINQEVIDASELDDNFVKYLTTSSNAVQVLITNMFENSWNFIPMEKFMWIYIMLACKYEPRAIKYLINSPFFLPQLIIKKDKFGFSPLFHALQNPHLDISMFHDFLDKN